MLNLDFLEKGLTIVSPLQFVYDILRKMFPMYSLLTDKISLPDPAYFLRYWPTCVLKLFLNQVVTSFMLKLTVYFKSSQFLT